MLVLPASRADGRWRGRASPCADTVAPADSRWLAWLSAMSDLP